MLATTSKRLNRTLIGSIGSYFGIQKLLLKLHQDEKRLLAVLLPGKSMLFNMLSRFVIAFLPRSKHFLREFTHSVNIFNCVLGTSHVLDNIVTKTQMLSDFMGFLV